MAQTDDPTWLRAAAVAAALAGLRDATAFEGFVPGDAAVAARSLAAMRASGDRGAMARAITREALAVTRAAVAPTDPRPGARFLARWLRGMPPGDRAVVARGMDPATARAVAAAARDAEALADPAIAMWLVAHARGAAGRLPTAAEWTAVLTALATGADAGLLAAQVVRRARVCGRGARCAVLALAVMDLP